MNPRCLIWVFALLALGASGLSRSRNQKADTATLLPFPGWAGAPVPRSLSEVALSPRDLRFARGFPGKIEAFADGPGSYLVRWVTSPTRLLHSSSDCLRGAGYAVHPGAAWRDERENLWASFTAEREGVRWQVRERIVGADQQTWTDVSAWYWSAVFGRSRGPWWAITWLEPEA